MWLGTQVFELGCLAGWRDTLTVGASLKHKIVVRDEAEDIWLILLECTHPFTVLLLVEGTHDVILLRCEMPLLKRVEVAGHAVDFEACRVLELLQVLVVEDYVLGDWLWHWEPVEI